MASVCFCCLLSVIGYHIPLYIYAHHGVGCIGAYSDRLFHMARKFAFAIVGDAELALGTWSDRVFGVICHGATARRESLLYDQRFVAGIGEHKFVMHLLGFLESAEVVCGLVKFDNGLSHCPHAGECGNDQQKKYTFHHMQHMF